MRNLALSRVDCERRLWLSSVIQVQWKRDQWTLGLEYLSAKDDQRNNSGLLAVTANSRH
jgi:hypothetical protein